MQDLLTSILAPSRSGSPKTRNSSQINYSEFNFNSNNTYNIKKVERFSNKPFEQRKFDGFKKDNFSSKLQSPSPNGNYNRARPKTYDNKFDNFNKVETPSDRSGERINMNEVR